MSKKSRKRRKSLYDTPGYKEEMVATMKELQSTEGPTPTEPEPRNKPKSNPVLSSGLLSSVREAVLKAHADTARNIAELEAWRAEIDCTIAFLRAQRK
jgi:hypothetical protein